MIPHYTDIVYRFLPIGSFVGNDGKSIGVAIFIQTLVRLVDVGTGRPLPSVITHGIKGFDTIKYPEDIQKGWAQYLNSERTDWLLHNKQIRERYEPKTPDVPQAKSDR